MRIRCDSEATKRALDRIRAACSEALERLDQRTKISPAEFTERLRHYEDVSAECKCVLLCFCYVYDKFRCLHNTCRQSALLPEYFLPEGHRYIIHSPLRTVHTVIAFAHSYLPCSPPF